MEPTTPTPPQAPQVPEPLKTPQAPQPTAQPTPPPENKSKLMIALVVVLIVAVVASAWFVFHKKKAAPKTSTTNLTVEDGTKQTEAELGDFKQAATIQVTVSGPAPSTLNVPVGTKIVWQNTDSKPHEIAISPGEAVPFEFLTNRTINVGGAYPYVANRAGTFHYFYVDAPTLTGVVVVK